MKTTRAALFKTGGVKVMRSVYSLPTQLLTTMRLSSLSAFVPGKRDAVCPSGPIPSNTRSKRGICPSSRRKLERRSLSYSSAASAALSISPLMRCTCFESTGAFASIASEAIRKLLSASSGGTCRSSPTKNWILFQGTIARKGPLFSSSAYSAFGVEPPARATAKESFRQTASRAASTNSAAAVCAMALASARILISRLVVVVVIVGIAVVIVLAHPGDRTLNCRGSLTRLGQHALFTDRSPYSPVARQQLIGFGRSPASGRIVRKTFGA